MEWLLDLIFPKSCVICGSKKVFICHKCKLGLRPATLKDLSGKETLRALWPVYEYKQREVKKIIKAVKYRFLKGLVQELMEDVVIDEDWKEVDLIVPIPLHKQKENRRGFNQAKVIGDCLVQRIDKPCVELLERIKATKPLAEMKKVEERRKEIEGAFRVKNEVKGKLVLLVDDVYTSGATMREAALELRKAGAKEVWGFVLAS